METFLIITCLLIVSVTLLIGYNMYLNWIERRNIVKMGLDPSLLNIFQKKRNYSKAFLYTGILLFGITLGISSGIILAKVFKQPGETKEFIILGLIVWTGISCIVCYFLSRDKGN